MSDDLNLTEWITTKESVGRDDHYRDQHDRQ
jgi:hypothetical protein